MNVYVQIYLIGLVTFLAWWLYLSTLMFEKTPKQHSASMQKSLDKFRLILLSFGDENPQQIYFIFSTIVSILWPIFLLIVIASYFTKKNK